VTSLAVVLVILGVAAVAAFGLLFVQASARRRAARDIPPAMRPGYSDEQLERGVLERYMAWGLVLTLFFALFLPIYWLREPRRVQAQQEEDFVESFVRGEDLYVENCSSCHGVDGGGGAAASPYDTTDTWPAPNLRTMVARYADSPTISDVEDLMVTTIRRGRPGTPMPTWSAAFGGPLTDQQINDIAAWLLANQEDEVAAASPASAESGEQLYQGNCARCHGENLEGIVGPRLVGLFERHNAETVLGILRNGVNLGNGVLMPPWQQGYTYPDARYEDAALERIVGYLQSRQPGAIPEGAQGYQSPFQGPDSGEDEAESAPTEEPTASISTDV
jgi:mono/diheme cytochrome c family protein